MPDNALARSRRGRTNPVDYVNNYDAMSDRLHPQTRAQMDPMIDALERSQVMRGARRTGPDWEENEGLGAVEEMARSIGWEPRIKDPRESFMDMLLAATHSDAAGTDAGIATIVRTAKTYGFPNPFGDEPTGRGAPPDYVFGNRRPTSLQMNPEIPGNERPTDPFAYRVRRPSYTREPDPERGF